MRVTVEGFGSDILPNDETNLVAQSALRLFAATGNPPPAGLRIHCVNDFPTSSGMGSSSAAIVMGLVGANQLLEQPFSTDDMLALANEIEGHPDNVAPALLGGLTMATRHEGRVIARCVDVPPLRMIIAVPIFALSTKQSRAALPEMVLHTDAVFNVGRVPLVVEALRTGDLSLLASALDDRLHQPYRLKLMPFCAEAIRAAKSAGAPAAALSGAGPGVVAFLDADTPAERVLHAMTDAFSAHGLKRWGQECKPSLVGAEVLSS